MLIDFLKIGNSNYHEENVKYLKVDKASGNSTVFRAGDVIGKQWSDVKQELSVNRHSHFIIASSDMSQLDVLKAMTSTEFQAMFEKDLLQKFEIDEASLRDDTSDDIHRE